MKFGPWCIAGVEGSWDNLVESSAISPTALVISPFLPFFPLFCAFFWVPFLPDGACFFFPRLLSDSTGGISIPESVGTEDDEGAKKGGGIVDDGDPSVGLPPMISISSSSSAIKGLILLRFRVVTRGEERGVSSRACGGVEGGTVGNVNAGG